MPTAFVAPVLASSLGHDLLVVLFGSALASVLAWVIGSRVGYMWDDRKRRRESDLAALATYYQVYGEFFETWKLWSASKDPKVATPADVQWRLLERAASAEGRFEALLIKLVSERQLLERDRLLLGCFREGYQMLREKIKADELLGWRASPSHPPGSEQYAAFKSLAEYVAVLLRETSPKQPVLASLVRRARTHPAEADAIKALREITVRSKFHDDWWELATKELC